LGSGFVPIVKNGLHFAHEHLFTIKPDPVGTKLKVRSLHARSALKPFFSPTALRLSNEKMDEGMA